MKLKDAIEFNPTEKISKNIIAKKVGMEKLSPFYKYITGYNYEKYSGGAKFRNGDTLVARITPCLENGKTAYVNILEGNEIGFGSTEFIVMRNKENITISEYVYYLAISEKFRDKAISLMTGTSGRQRVQIDPLKEEEFDIPSVSNQKKIVKLLSKIDNKIKLNNEINNNLFELVLNDFNDFLNKNTDSEMVKLEDCVEKINTGADAIQRAPIVDYDTGIRCIRIGDMTNGRDYHSWGFTKMADKDFENYKLIRNDIVITRTAVNGLTYMITDEENTVCNNGNIRLRVNSKYNPLYIYLNTKTKDFRNYIDRINSETSVRPNMKVEYFTSYEIKKIDLAKQNDFCARAESIMKKIQNNKVENYNLEQLRDTLLPKLMNGEIDLDNIEI